MLKPFEASHICPEGDTVPPQLVYVLDPMCSWCWAFAPVWQQLQHLLQQRLSGQLQYLFCLGGLAPDSDQPMPMAQRQQIQQHWRHIEQLVGRPFNHDFWHKNTPRRSTYPACRAVLAADYQAQAEAMIEAIQRAYYLHAQNPSDTSTLIDCASQIGLDRQRFAHHLLSTDIEVALQTQLNCRRQLQANSFPSLRLGSYHPQSQQFHYRPIDIDYQSSETMFSQIARYLDPQSTEFS